MASVGDREGAYRVLMGRPDGKRPVGRPRHKLKDNVKIDCK